MARFRQSPDPAGRGGGVAEVGAQCRQQRTAVFSPLKSGSTCSLTATARATQPTHATSRRPVGSLPDVLRATASGAGSAGLRQTCARAGSCRGRSCSEIWTRSFWRYEERSCRSGFGQCSAMPNSEVTNAGACTLHQDIRLLRPAGSSGFRGGGILAQSSAMIRGTLAAGSRRPNAGGPSYGLVWYDERSGVQLPVDAIAAIVATSTALMKTARAATNGTPNSFFSITSDGATYTIGADDDSEMRAWMSAILAQQGDKDGAAAILTGRTSLCSYQISSPLAATTAPSAVSNDPLGGQVNSHSDRPDVATSQPNN